MSRPQWALLLIVALSCGVLGTVNFYTAKTTSALRAYINGESYYSKGQKDASRQLAFFLINPEQKYYDQFKQDISAPLGDSIARVNLLRNGSMDTIRAGFLQGRNHPEDVEEMIWLFKNFKEVSFMAEAISIWAQADGLVSELNAMADSIYKDRLKHIQNVESNVPYENGDRQLSRLKEIDQLTNQLTGKEREFSEHMGHTARRMTGLLFVVNIFFILVIVGCSALLSAAMVRSLMNSKKELAQRNRELENSNKRLDHFIYASSHDLKAPITNLEGLVALLEAPIKPIPVEDLLDKVKFSISTLKHTISDIEGLMKTDRLGLGDEEYLSFEAVYKQILAENETNFALPDVEMITAFHCPRVHYSHLGLKSIMQNLLSNAVKYRSPARPARIEITTDYKNERAVLMVSDNGLGMDLERHGDKVFEMFKRLHSHVPGSGLGLYAVKQVVEKNGGSISVESKEDKGSTFTVFF
jgi:signal transduction histidine kinase